MICVPFPATVVNKLVQLRNGRGSFSILTKARPLSCVWKNTECYGCRDRPPECPELVFIEFNQFVPPSKNTHKICNIQANWVVPPSSRSKELIRDFQSTLRLFPGVTAPQLQPTKPHKPMSPKAGITKYQGMRWDPDLDHTSPM